MKKYNSCLNCNHRHLGCHGTCEDYKKYKEELERIKQNKKLARLEAPFKRRNYINGQH